MADFGDVVELPGGLRVALPRLLDNVRGCRPEDHRLTVQVPEAGAPLSLELEDLRVRVEGGLDQKIRGLKVAWKSMGVRVQLRARVWSIGAR